MEEGVFASILELIERRPLWLVAAAFGFALLESLAIVGIFIPGIILLFLVGAVIGLDLVLFLWCWLAAMLGALGGDFASYWIGRQFRDEIPRLWPMSRRPDVLAAGQVLFARHGGKSVFIGRFIGPIRPVVPMMAGMLGLRSAVFLAFAVPAGLLWAPLYLLPGMLFGASLELAAEFAGRLVLLLLIVVLGTWFVIWLTRLIYEFTARRSGWWLRSLIRWTNRHPLAGRLVGDLLEPGRPQVISIALLGLILAASIVLLLSLLIAAPFAQPTWDAERQVAGLAASLRSHFADPVFVALALAGGLEVMALLAALTGVLLLARGRHSAAWYWAAATIGGWLLAEMISGLMMVLLPAAAEAPSLAEIPHRAFALNTVVLGFFAVMLAKDLSARRRKWPYLATSAVLALIGFSHFYLGRASVIGLTAAFALGLGWLALVGIGYRRRAQTRTRPVLLGLVFYGSFLAIAGFEVHSESGQLLVESRLIQPERRLERGAWLAADWRTLPERRSRLGNYEQQRFDLQLGAEIGDLSAALAQAGWWAPATAEPLDVLRRLPLAASLSEAAHLPRDFAGRPEDLLMVRDAADGVRFLIRLWDSGARLAPDQAPLWLGQVRAVRMTPGMAGLQRWKEAPEFRAAALSALLDALSAAELRELPDGPLLISLPSPTGSQPAQSAAPGRPDALPGR